MSIINFTIIICAFNPEEEVFSRTLASVQNLAIPSNIEIECLIIDNNSETPLHKLPYVHDFLTYFGRAKVILESKQGLTFARIKGIQHSTSPFLVLVDDDNELSPDYIEAALDHLNSYPHVGAWGPGRVRVDFVHPVSDSFRTNFRYFFQEKDSDYIEYGNVPGRWMEFYPFGTGLIITRQVAEQYCREVNQGRLASTDRKGGSLSSGGDIQIVWEAIKLGYSAGISPKLCVNHLIPNRRSNFKYIKRLVYGNSSSYWPALIQSFPEKKALLHNRISSLKASKALLKIILLHLLRLDFINLQIELAKYLGETAGALNAVGNERLKWLHKLASLLSLE